MSPVASTWLQANLDALPPVAQRAVGHPDAADLVRLHEMDAQWSASIRTRDGRWVRIHSGWDPVKEADRFLDAALPGGPPPVLMVIGPGLGYVLEAIERRAAATKVIALEPFAAVTRAMLERRDWRGWVQSGRLTILSGPQYLGASDAWRIVDERAVDPPILEHPVLKREFPVEMAQARRVAAEIVKGARSNATARKMFAGRYLLNTLENLESIISEGDASLLADRLTGVPAVVVAAGPSLDKNIEPLKAIADRVLVVAVDTALRPLREAGIRPHLVVAVDPSEINARHLIDIEDTRGSWLVSEGSIDARVLREFAGRTFTFKVSDHQPWPWMKARGFSRGTLRAWGSVLTTAFDLACCVGCDPIVFVGADLAYTDGLHYCRSTIHEGEGTRAKTSSARAADFAEWRRQQRRPTCEEADVQGEPALTTPHFVQFRDWLVARSIEVAPRRVLNATGAGILHGAGLIQADLDQLSGELAASGAPDICACLRAARDESLDRERDVRQQFSRSLVQITKDGLPLETWLDFAGGAVSVDQITSRIEAGWWSSPKVISQPRSLTRLPGWTASLTAAASGGPTPNVQWQVSDDDGASWSDIPGATAAVHTVTMTAALPGKQFRAVFANVHGSATTLPARVMAAVDGVAGDFNQDRKSDILWRHLMTGETSLWFVLRAPWDTGVLDSEPDLEWAIAGVADFNGDGKPDVLWRHLRTGAQRIWYIDGLQRTGQIAIEAEPDLTWRVVGIGDFTGSGKPDLLWRNSRTGAIRVWCMDEATRMDVRELDIETDLSWEIVATADLNGDGRPDILWRNVATGANRMWLMDGMTRASEVAIDAEPDLTWSITGAGDFSGNGQVDLVWRNSSSGADRLWCMNGVVRTAVVPFEPVPELNWIMAPERREQV